MSAHGVTKATALAVLAERHEIKPSQVVAFGDMPNDLPMLSWAGTSYAVANAHPRVLAAVDHVTAANNDDGVARVLEELFRSRTTEGDRRGLKATEEG
jgi:hydroxymethylpyrimidine pyrophosphatase-like HAD family hydrolase